MSLSDAEVAVAAALAGAEVVARDYGATRAPFAKSATDLATETDVDAEAAIVTVHASHRPQDRFTGEESGDGGPAASPRRWLIDSLCGTLNFAATTPPARGQCRSDRRRRYRRCGVNRADRR